MPVDIHYLGIRHHGPGSARHVYAALEALQPEQVLIEGPSDASDLISLLMHAHMQVPVALLSYAVDQPQSSIYYPFTEYSPEYQAILWAHRAHKPVHFIDIPFAIRFAQHQQEALATEEAQEEPAQEEAATSQEEQSVQPQDSVHQDPLLALARLAGYTDGEAWWHDVMEQSQAQQDPLQIFQHLALAMEALREAQGEEDQEDHLREAYMRVEIQKLSKQQTQGCIAVVCGAWHLPALKQKVRLTADKQTLKSLPKKLAASKYKTTWIPWTSPRLAQASGYGAGVQAPQWYQHLWQFRERDPQESSVIWLVHVASLLRDAGHFVSSASVIEAQRLAVSLAALRGRLHVGLSELKSAVLACLCFGDQTLWHSIEEALLMGDQVGEIPADAPLVPLLEDLKRLQKTYRLPPQATTKEYALDLRTDLGLKRSHLLHRLSLLSVPWGHLLDAQSGRGTFREVWQLKWQPEYSVHLVEHLVYGTSIEIAANRKMCAHLQAESQLTPLAQQLHVCLTADLQDALDLGLQKLSECATYTHEGLSLLTSIVPLVDVSRYGSARQLSLAHVDALIARLVIQAGLALPYESRQLNAQEAEHYRQAITQVHQAVNLHFAEQDDVLATWWDALEQMFAGVQTTPLLRGLSARLLYQAQHVTETQVQKSFNQSLSSAIPASEAAAFFEGFFNQAADLLIYDQALAGIVNTWLMQLPEEDFTHCLPLLRRVFSSLDTQERKSLYEQMTRPAGMQLNTHLSLQYLPLWQQQSQQLHAWLEVEKHHG
ncbi:hypothetical protein SAMN05421831_103200 [Allopseudospirillum japonicum]|uniref:Uncharacterized protein n=1 Tax=Allopseudospirillum japonicum TaxID=64971 RepID=A0A1H6RJC1_9GAMM|nr:DUF5682 family protein [Allopseudospirillum japonicum]SEI52617.1 hypothetical protein SAMN05421831_103200 [Allopseudospirillum japonicum]